MNLRKQFTLLVVSTVGLLACAQGEPKDDTGMMEDTSESMSRPSQSLMLTALNESGITGTAEITYSDDMATVVLDVSGLTPGESYAAHIHEGTCEEGGPPVVTLNAVMAGEDGTGTSTTEFAVSDLTGETGMMSEDEGAMEENQGAMAEDTETMEEDQGKMAQDSGMMEEDQGAMAEESEMDHHFVQIHLPTGSPAACANVKPSSSG